MPRLNTLVFLFASWIAGVAEVWAQRDSLAGFRTDKREPIIEIRTDSGSFFLFLFHETPMHRKNFLYRCMKGDYYKTSFHRLIQDFIIQGGDPLSLDANPENDGEGGKDSLIQPEYIPGLRQTFGTLSMAREIRNPRSNYRQFFICLSDDSVTTSTIQNQYTIFGCVVGGHNILRKLNQIRTTPPAHRPNPACRMTTSLRHYSRRELLKTFPDFEKYLAKVRAK